MSTSDENTKLSFTLIQFVKSGLWLPVVILFLLYQLLLTSRSKAAKKLQDKVVLITGASSGLGEALAHAFYKAGCKVILASRREEELERVKREILAAPKKPTVPTHEPEILKLDLLDLNAIPIKVEETMAIHGSIDVLVNNSGITSRGDAQSTSVEVDHNIMIVNYLGHVALTKGILPTMVSRGSGHIVGISSILGKIALPYRSSYSASKFAMGAFFDCLRSELSDKNVRVTMVYPGYIRTNLSINAVKADGTQHGVMDAQTASGITSKEAARRIVLGVVRGEQEMYIAPFASKMIIHIRHLWPSLYFSIMAKRAKKNPSPE